MKTRELFFAVAFLSLWGASAQAWNLDAKYISALEFFNNGRIEFTLFATGAADPEFRCAEGERPQWFFISACRAADSACLAGVQRMGAMLLAAKLAGKQVHVERRGAGTPPRLTCEVTQVALKP